MKNATTLVLVLSSVFLVNLASFAQKKPNQPGIPDTPTTNIVNGNSTTIDQQPWQVYLSAGSGATAEKCGGTIIGPYAILTAAHCVNNFSASQVTVYAGITDKSNLASGQTRSVSQVTVNPSYDAPSLVNDIAILRLSTALNFNANVQPIRYDGGSSVDNPGTAAVASGWGKTCNTCGLPDILQRANLTTVDITTLNQVDYGALNGNMIAAGNNSTGTCDGDSGGPLWVSNGGQNYLIGISSKKPSAGCATNPSIFTRVSSFCSWILPQISSDANIVGSVLICNSANFSVDNQPLNTVISSWSSSNPAALSISSNGVAVRQNNFNGNVTITATFTNSCGGSGSISRTVNAGTPVVEYPNLWLFDAGSNMWQFSHAVSPGATSWTYYVASGSATLQQNVGDCYITTTSGASVCVYATNSCGSGTAYCFDVPAGGGGYMRTVSPNPAKDRLTLQFSNTKSAATLPSDVYLYSEKSTKPVKSIAVQEVYKQKAFEDGDKINVPVGDLPRGIYYLHVVPGQDSKQPAQRLRVVLD